MACEGYHQLSVRTGYDSVVAQRTGDLFAFTAKKPGTVREVNEHGVIVDYDDGDTQGFEIGRRFGTAAGLVMAHSVVTPLKAGDKFEIGDAIVYNDGFFEPDFFNPKRVVMKMSMEVATVLWESPETHEDSSAISTRVSDKLSTHTTKVKYVVVRFDQAINHIANAGEDVSADSVLCTVEDDITANSQLFDEKSIETLKSLSAQTPRAHVQGKLERIEFYYHGEKEDMSPTLRELCNKSDKLLKKRAIDANKQAFTGKVDGGFRIDGTPLMVDTIAIKFYITSRIKAGVGDKGVFANQLKTVFGDVIEGEMKAEDGTIIDGVFGCKSVEARIVNSPFSIGTASTLLKVIAEQAVEIYEGKR